MLYLVGGILIGVIFSSQIRSLPVVGSKIPNG